MATVTVTAAGSTLTVTPTDAVPDLRKAFVATIPRNHIGTNDATISVNAAGLLHSESSAKTTSQLTAILEGIVSSGAIGRNYSFTRLATQCSAGTHTKVLIIEDDGKLAGGPGDKSLCEFTFEVEPMANNELPPKGVAVPSGGAHGLYYRQQRPYKVIATRTGDPAARREFLILSPTGSNTYFLRASGAIFGNNTAGYTFENGVPTKYGQKLESELVGITGLPATLLTAYFKAIGTAFSSQQTAASNETSYLNALSALDAARERREACIAALGTDDLTIIKAACSQ